MTQAKKYFLIVLFLAVIVFLGRILKYADINFRQTKSNEESHG